VLVVCCVLLATVVAVLSGGRLVRLATIAWRASWLLPAALLLQVVIVEVPGLPRGPSEVVHVATYIGAAVFVVLNRRVPGLWLLALGAACNGVTIALNGGTLPSTPQALAAAGIRQDGGFVNSGVVAHPVLGWLGDVFALPGPTWLQNVFSVGDVLIVAGAAWTILVVTHRPGRVTTAGGLAPESA
jgi:hypothetical protein